MNARQQQFSFYRYPIGQFTRLDVRPVAASGFAVGVGSDVRERHGRGDMQNIYRCFLFNNLSVSSPAAGLPVPLVLAIRGIRITCTNAFTSLVSFFAAVIHGGAQAERSLPRQKSHSTHFWSHGAPSG